MTSPPTIPGWNLVLRIGLELAALTGLGLAAWKLNTGPMKWAAALTLPSVFAAIWGVFNVLDDPSRSGNAPIEVSGTTRLLIELSILAAGAAAIWFAGGGTVGIAYIALVLLHYAASTSRIRWLVHA